MALTISRTRRPRVAAEIDTQVDPEVLVAAALDLRGDSEERKGYRKSLPAWQRQALEFYDLIGEAWYPAQFYARQLSRVRLYPARRLPNGEVEEIDDPKAQEILARIRDAGGGQSEWKAQYGRLQFLIGDGTLVASLDEEKSERWEYLSPAEFQAGDMKNGRRTYVRKMQGGVDREYLAAAPGEELETDTVRAWRLWNRHPLQSWLADSPMRAVLAQFRLLMLLDKAAEAQALSRIVGAGLLVVDDRITIPASDSEAADESVEDDPFMQLLTKYITAPIGEPGSASAVAPLVARVQMPEGVRAEDLIKLVQLHDPNQTADWHTRIEKTITRIAIGLDMPPEEFLGLAQANHWTGWVITEEKWKAHGEPVTIRLCEDLTSAYFRPACMASGVADAEDLTIWYDPAQVVTHPDLGKSANEVFDRGALKGAALRRAHNFSESDAPSEDEHDEWLLVKTMGRVTPEGVAAEEASPTGADAPGAAPENNGPRTDQPSPQPGNQQMAIIRGAAAMAIERCRELAGSRLGSKRMSCEGCFKGTEGVPRADLAAVLGEEIVRTLGFTSELALVKGATEPFVRAASIYGMEDAEAKRLAAMIEAHAAATLYTPGPMSLSFEISEEFRVLSEAA